MPHDPIERWEWEGGAVPLVADPPAEGDRSRPEPEDEPAAAGGDEQPVADSPPSAP